jgi:hypothetical protein
MWYLRLNEEEKEKFNAYLESSYTSFDVMSKSNTRLFKSMYNTLMRLKSFLSQKWMQN